MEQLSALLMARQAPEDGGPEVFRFRAVTTQENRYGYVVTADGWELEAFRRNPVFLFSHDYSAAPIGRVRDIVADAEGLVADVVFDQEDPLALSVQRKYREGFLNAVSVGFDPLEFMPPKDGQPLQIVRKELLELSAVAVPADAGALRMGLDEGLKSTIVRALKSRDRALLLSTRELVNALLDGRGATPELLAAVEQAAQASGNEPPAEPPVLDLDLSALTQFASR